MSEGHSDYWRYGWPYFMRFGIKCAWSTRRLGLWWSLKLQWGLAWEPLD